MAKVLHGGQSFTPALDEAIAGIPSARDKAFIAALCLGVLRAAPRLSALLGILAEREIRDPYVHALAMLGLFQLSDSGVKPHAAVAETVAAAGQRRWAKPLLNAILRRYQREQQSLAVAVDADEAVRYLHPQWLLERLRRDWPGHTVDILTANNARAPLTLRVNRLRLTREAYLQTLAEGQHSGLSGLPPDSVVMAGFPRVEELPGYAIGDFSVQDVSAQWAAELIAIENPSRVLDLCAAPGGKTCHLLERWPAIEQLVAVDITAERLSRLQANLERLGHRAQVLRGDARTPDNWWDGRPFDRILVDAPCSGTGVIRRHPDIKALRRDSDIDALTQTQSAILDAAWRVLAPGGRLLYSTCSVLKSENEGSFGRFLDRHANARPVSLALPVGRVLDFGVQLFPGEAQGDGFYYAAAEKVA